MKKEEYIDIFTHNIKWLRIESGLSVKQMSVILKTTPHNIVLLEHGILPAKLRADILVDIYKLFDIPIEFLTEVKLKNQIKIPESVEIID